MSEKLASREPSETPRSPVGSRVPSINDPPDGEPSADEARQMLNCLAAGIAKISRDGRIVYVNAQARRILTVPDRDLVGISLHEFEPFTILPDGTPLGYDDYPPIKCMQSGELQIGVTLGVKLTGERILWVTVTAKPLLDPTTGRPEAALVTVVGSTQPQHVEESLRQSEDRYRRLVENSPDAIVVHRGGPIVFINDAGVKLWRGRSREDFIGRNILDFVHPRDRENASHRVEAAMAGGYTPLIEQRHVRLDGKPVMVEVTGTSCIYDGQRCVQAVFRDVTRRKKMDRQLRRQREILRVFFRRIPVLVGIYGPDGRAKAVNREWRRVTGWGKDVPLVELLKRFYPDPTERQQAIDYLEAAMPGWRDFRVHVADGRTRLLSWANIVLSSGDRIVIALDVTERRRAEELLRQAKDELEHRVAERTEELTRKNVELQRKQRFMERSLAVQERDRKLVAYEIHDTILQEVIGALMYVDTIYANENIASSSVGRQLELTRKLLRKCIDEARQMISGLRPPVIDEQGVVGAIDYLVSEFNARGMAIRYSHEMHAERLEPDLETTIFRIVQEALTNVERHSGTKQAEVRVSQRGATIRIEVRDRGAGFDVEGVGERHYGLDGVRERARLVGGWASIVSQPGQGSHVVVELPAKEPR